MAGRIRLLFLGSEPSDTPRVRVGAEARNIKAALRANAASERFEVIENHAVRLDELQRIVVNASAEIVHFAGHGANTGELMFEDADGWARAANPDALATLFKLAGTHTRLVVLNACYSHDQAIEIADHIDVVVGLTAAIPVSTALAFSGELYSHLAGGKSVGSAFDLAQNHVRLLNLPGIHMLQIVPRKGIDPHQVFVTGAKAALEGVATDPVRPAGSGGPPHTLEPAEVRIRTRYLKQLRADIENQITESIHNARFMDLGISDSPTATHLPWVYKNPDSTREFRRLDEAFRAYDRRLLLLGAPGAGKTVSLQHLAIALLNEADADPGAPIPLIVNLSKFRFKASPLAGVGDEPEGPRDRSFESWLASELGERGVRRLVAERWVEDGRIAALLDGLDEVNDERRADLASLLNATFLRAHPDSVVVICSRIDEYRPVQARKATRLQLAGAITLQPLSSPQIAAYLDAADASGLREALGRDESLNELAQTPLTLSMMTLAYGRTSASRIPSVPGIADQRHHLIESFVARMLQRKERRDRRIPFDDDEDKDVPEAEYRYPPDRMNRYLSWLAVRLSLRMQTACSLRRFHGFLERRIAVDETRSTEWVMGLARLVLLAAAMGTAALSLLPVSCSDLFCAEAIGIGGGGLYMAAFFAKRRRERFRSLGKVGLVLACLFWQLAVARSLLTMSTTATAMSLGFIVVVGEIAVAMAIVGWFEASKKPWAVSVCTVAGTVLGVASTELHMVTGSSAAWVAACMASGQTIGVFLWMVWSHESSSAAALLAATGLGSAAGLVELQSVALSAFGGMTWQPTLGLICYSLLVLQLRFEQPTAAMLGLLALVVTGSELGGPDLAVLGGAAWGITLLMLALAVRRSDRLKRMVDAVNARCERAADIWILSPVARSLFGVLGMLPHRPRAVARHAGQALILKPFRGNIEFVHRRLRDHFALRELIPRLQQAELGRRSGVIHALGLQGIAAIDTLTDLIAEGRADERAAAVRALGRIAAPEIAGHLARAFGDTSPEVRSAVVRSLRHVDDPAALAILDSAVHDADSDVVKAVIDEVRLVKERSSRFGPPLITRIFAVPEQTHELVRHVAAMPNTDLARDAGHALHPTARDTVRELLEDRRPAVRRLACDWMQSNLSVSDVGLLAERVRTDAEGDVRTAAFQALAASWDDRAVPGIVSALADPWPTIRAEAAEVLGRRREEQALGPLIQVAQGRDARIHAIEALGRLRDPRAVDCLLLGLRNRRADIRAAAAYALAASGHMRGITPLLEALVDRKASVRGAAANALGALRDARAVESLLRALSDKDGFVRMRAAHSLGALRDPRALGPLVQMMEDRRAGPRIAAADSLGKIGDPRTLEALLRGLSDMHRDVRAAVAQSLGSLGDRRAVMPLIELLHSDTDNNVRASAARSLGSLGDRRAVMPLIEALDRGTEEILHPAAESLSRLGDPRAVEPLLRMVTSAQDGSIDRLRSFPTEAVIPYLQSHGVWVRRAAARALGNAADAAALEPMIEALRDPDTDVRGLAAIGLGALGFAAAFEPLVRALADRESSWVRRAASMALGQLGDARAADTLIGLMTDEDHDVRAAAIGSLCALGDLRGEKPALAILTAWSYGDDGSWWEEPNHQESLGWMIRGLFRLETAAARTALTRGLTDSASIKRSEIVEALAHDRGELDRALLSGDYDGRAPWIDPCEPISRHRIEQCAARLGLTSLEVRIRYEALAPELALRLSWMSADQASAGGEPARRAQA